MLWVGQRVDKIALPSVYFPMSKIWIVMFESFFRHL